MKNSTDTIYNKFLVFNHNFIYFDMKRNNYQVDCCHLQKHFEKKTQSNYYNYIILHPNKEDYTFLEAFFEHSHEHTKIILIDLKENLPTKLKKLKNLKFIKGNQASTKILKQINEFIQRSTKKEYKQLLEEYKNIVDKNSIISMTDPDGIITYANKNFCKVSGFSKDELIGQSHRIVRHPDVSEVFFEELWKTISNNEVWRGIVKNQNKEGQTYYVDTMIKPINHKNRIMGYISIRNEITQILDPKEALIDDIKNSHNPMLIIAKINEFEQFEEYYTNTIIKKIEQTFSNEILNFMPKESGYKKVYPLGNGEFALLKEINKKKYNHEYETYLLKQFQNNVSNGCLMYDKYEFNIHVTIAYDIGSKSIYENARLGIKQAKKNKLSLVNAKNLKRISRKHIIENIKTINLIKEAIENHQIKTYYQPISCNKCNKIVKYESLVRIVKPNDEVIRPIHFINAAKKLKYYTQITDTMIHNIFFAMREYKKNISLNLSSYDIEDNRIREKIIDMIFEYNVANNLTIELLEDEESKDFTKVKNFITIVKKMGVKIAIDDFGSGYSNFNRLMQFEPDILKIDGSIIRNMDSNAYNKHIVDTIINFASKQKIKTVAEFVYNEEIYKIVKAMGIDYSQGYFIGKPKPYFLD